MPVYLIIKRRKQAGIPGRHIKEYYAPKPIWATCAEEIENWIRQLSGPDAPTTKIKIVANAKEALDCIPDLDISELKHANIAEINCLVVLY